MKRIKRIRVVRFLYAAVIGASIGAVITAGAAVLNFRKYKTEMSEYFEVKQLIDKYYYEDADDSAYIDNALKGMVYGLGDPYASYMTPEEFGQSKEQTSGVRLGIGVTVSKTDTGYEIKEIVDGSPASEADVEPGDIITQVNGVKTENMEFDDVLKMIKGEIGTFVILTLERDGKTVTSSVERGEIKSITVDSQMLDDSIYYIKISSFKDVTGAQFLEALKTGISDNAEGLVIDLRDNGGGVVEACQDCLDPFLPEGDIATAEYKDGTVKVICRSDADELHIPTVLLVNENTASASELFASALRDYDKAEIVGKKTFGKGIMQITMQLSNGGALKLTAARYKTAKSECFHGIGIEPDYEVDLAEGTDISVPDTKKDAQLKKAVELLAAETRK